MIKYLIIDEISYEADNLLLNIKVNKRDFINTDIHHIVILDINKYHYSIYNNLKYLQLNYYFFKVLFIRKYYNNIWLIKVSYKPLPDLDVDINNFLTCSFIIINND